MSAPPTHTNGNFKLTSFAQLATLVDLHAAATETADEAPTAATHTEPATNSQDTSLADVIAQLASMSAGLETMARDDAREREQAAVELARYEALVAERQDAERSLADARRVRASAEELAAKAFSEEARTTAARHAASSRNLELRCVELLAERRRAADELASRPHLTRILAERQRLADEQAEAVRTAETARANRLSTGLAAVDHALHIDDVDQARTQIQALAREFADNAEVRRRLDVVRWRLRSRLVAPVEAALRDVSRRAYRNDPEAALARLAELSTEGLPQDLAQRLFGVWSNACWQVVQLRGWTDPRRETPGISRGAVWARTPAGTYEVVSSMSYPRWQVGQLVPDRIGQAAPVLRSGPARQQGTSSSAD